MIAKHAVQRSPRESTTPIRFTGRAAVSRERHGKADGPQDSSSFEVREALAQEGCPVCRLALRSVGRLMKSIAYEQINDVDLRADLRSTHGFCTTHAHRWLREVHNPSGTAIVYRDVLMSSARELDGSGSRRGLLDTLRGAPKAGGADQRCLACRTQREAEERYVETLLSLLGSDEAARTLLGASDGLCRLHVHTAQRHSGPAVELIVKHAVRRIELCVGELEEVIRKEDYRFRHEPRSEAERRAPEWAVTWAAGMDGLVESD
jgi:hypothetical protein